uniref:Transmembrane protein n=1 Tax=Heterorhabditis bacteriophora TaxID=37862 RepID=A0A1I7W5Y1_HETBA
MKERGTKAVKPVVVMRVSERRDTEIGDRWARPYRVFERVDRHISLMIAKHTDKRWVHVINVIRPYRRGTREQKLSSATTSFSEFSFQTPTHSSHPQCQSYQQLSTKPFVAHRTALYVLVFVIYLLNMHLYILVGFFVFTGLDLHFRIAFKISVRCRSSWQGAGHNGSQWCREDFSAKHPRPEKYRCSRSSGKHRRSVKLVGRFSSFRRPHQIGSTI